MEYKTDRLKQYEVSELVYFHAYTNPDSQDQYFLCKGYISRLPNKESPVYKIIIVAVDPKSILCGEQPDLAKQLLGKCIARKKSQLMLEPTGLIAKLYQGSRWINIDKKELKKIQNKVKRKRQEQRDNSMPTISERY